MEFIDILDWYCYSLLVGIGDSWFSIGDQWVCIGDSWFNIGDRWFCICDLGCATSDRGFGVGVCFDPYYGIRIGETLHPGPFVFPTDDFIAEAPSEFLSAHPPPTTRVPVFAEPFISAPSLFRVDGAGRGLSWFSRDCFRGGDLRVASTHLNIVTWNVEGFSDAKLITIQQRTIEFNVDIVCLQETHRAMSEYFVTLEGTLVFLQDVRMVLGNMLVLVSSFRRTPGARFWVQPTYVSHCVLAFSCEGGYLCFIFHLRAPQWITTC